MVVGGFDGNFQVPNNPGQPTLGYNVNGISSFNSAQLNETQAEVTAFAVLSLQKHVIDADVQLSVFNRTSTLNFSPDPIGDLPFSGIAQQAARQDVATGLQGDGISRIDDAHTLRAGFLAQIEQASSNTNSSLLPVDASGNQTSTQPLSIIENQSSAGGLYGVYVQDEWRLRPRRCAPSGLI